MEKEILERLTRVETKLDGALGHIEKVSQIDKDLNLIKKISTFFSAALVVAIGDFLHRLFNKQ